MGKKEEMPRELRNAGLIIDLFLTTVLLAVYREDYSLTMFVLTQPIALFLAFTWLEIVRRLR